MTTFRTNGAIGALLDEYEKALNELYLVIKDLNSEQLVFVVDQETTDPDCRSIQAVLTHVVESGYTYVIESRKYLGEDIGYKSKVLLSTAEQYIDALKKMFEYNEQLFADYPDMSIEDYDNKMKVRWGQYYDVEQIIEHAIVHILRHRRQIEKFIIKLPM